MKQLKILLLNLVYRILSLSGYCINHRKIVKLKLSVGILLLLSKGYNANAQLDIHRGTCYKTGPRYRKSIDIFVTDKFEWNHVSKNSLAANFGYQRKWFSSGLSFVYNFESNAADIGPYVRVFPVEYRRRFKNYLSVNYQFGLGKKASDAVNLSAGFILFHQRMISAELGVFYTYNVSNSLNNYFGPSIGVHYYLLTHYSKKKRSEGQVSEQ